MQMQFFDTGTSSEDTQKRSKMHEYEELWIDPYVYYGKKLEEPVTFKKKVGRSWKTITLPAGTVISDEFPDGLCIVRVDGKDILTYYNQYKGKCWKHAPFDINVDGFWADGLEDAVMNQQLINEYTSLSVENVLYNASPKLVINPELINPITVTGKPKDMLLLSNNARTDTDPKTSFAQIQGMTLTQEVMQGMDSFKRDMREQTGALVAFNGQGDPTLTTATAMSIARDSALALVSTPLSILAEIDQDIFREVLALVKKHWYDKKYSFLLGKYNDSEAKAFKDCNLDEELNVYVESNSWMPQTNYERLQNLGAFLTAFGIPMGFLNPTIPQPVRDYAAQLYNVPFDFNELAPDIRIAQRRLSTAKEIAGMQIPKALAAVQQMGEAGAALVETTEGEQIPASEAILRGTRTVIAEALAVEEDIDDLNVIIREYTNFLKTDEGQNAHPIFREAVKVALSVAKNFLKIQQAEEAQRLGLMAGAGAAPPSGDPSQNQFTPENPAEHPFAPQKVGEITDYSDNAKNLPAK